MPHDGTSRFGTWRLREGLTPGALHPLKIRASIFSSEVKNRPGRPDVAGMWYGRPDRVLCGMGVLIGFCVVWGSVWYGRPDPPLVPVALNSARY